MALKEEWCYCSHNKKNPYPQHESPEIKGTAQHFGKYFYLLSGRHLAEKIETSLMSVLAEKLEMGGNS